MTLVADARTIKSFVTPDDSAPPVIVLDVLDDCPAEMPFAERDHVTETSLTTFVSTLRAHSVSRTTTVWPTTHLFSSVTTHHDDSYELPPRDGGRGA